MIGDQDLTIPAAVQRFGAERAGARATREVAGGSHAVAMSNPDVVAETILDAVRWYRSDRLEHRRVWHCGGVGVEVVYETHSLSTDNEAGRATGWLPGRLSAAGRDLARELGRRRRGDNLSAVYVSDLARAVQTVRIAFDGSPIPVHLDRRLREINYGALNGAGVEQISAQKLDRIDVPFPGGQSYRQVVEQIRDLLTELAARWDGQRILIIAHSATRYALDHLLHDQPLEHLVTAPFDWQEGWHYHLPTNWTRT